MNAPLSFKIAVGLAAALLVSTAQAKPSKTQNNPVFFPPPPDEPRIQYLAGFSSEDQFAKLSGNRNFFNFVVGDEKIFRPILKPYGITTTPGKIYICDTVCGAVEVVDIAKKKISYFKPTGDATLGTPINIAVDKDGTRYISDTKREQVLVFKGENYSGAIGKKDEMRPVGIALSNNRIYVTDLKNHCVRVYEKGTLKELFTFPKAGADDKSGQLFSPTNVAIDSDGRVCVSDTGGFFVNLYEADGKFIKTVGDQGLSPGKFSLPKGIAVDREKRSYVVDANTQVVQMFDHEGQILMYFGDPSGSSGGVTGLPAGIAIDYDNVAQFQKFAAPNFQLEFLVYVTNQTGPQKVSIFGFGHKK